MSVAFGHTEGCHPRRASDIGAAAIPGFLARYRAGSEIHGEGEAAIYSYRLQTGVVRTYRLLSDGRRQIEDFLFPGDVFSLTLRHRYEESAEAVTDAQIIVMKRSLIDSLIESDAAVANEVLRWAFDSLARAREQMLLLGRKTAAEKVASFLLRLEATVGGRDSLILPMCRSDIADYLGLTVETVSRVLAQLEREQAIELPSCRQIKVLGRAKLASLSATR